MLRLNEHPLVASVQSPGSFQRQLFAGVSVRGVFLMYPQWSWHSVILEQISVFWFFFLNYLFDCVGPQLWLAGSSCVAVAHGHSSCGAEAQKLWCTALVALRPVGSSFPKQDLSLSALRCRVDSSLDHQRNPQISFLKPAPNHLE